MHTLKNKRCKLYCVNYCNLYMKNIYAAKICIYLFIYIYYHYILQSCLDVGTERGGNMCRNAAKSISIKYFWRLIYFFIVFYTFYFLWPLPNLLRVSAHSWKFQSTVFLFDWGQSHWENVYLSVIHSNSSCCKFDS